MAKKVNDVQRGQGREKGKQGKDSLFSLAKKEGLIFSYHKGFLTIKLLISHKLRKIVILLPFLLNKAIFFIKN